MSKGVETGKDQNDATKNNQESQQVQESPTQNLKTKSSNQHNISFKDKMVVHLSNTQSFSRVLEKDVNQPKIKSEKLKTQQIRLCLAIAKSVLDLIHCLETSDRNLKECSYDLQHRHKTLNLAQLSKRLKEMRLSISSSIKKFQQSAQTFMESEQKLIDLTNMLPKKLNFLCQRVQKNFHSISKHLIKMRSMTEKPSLTACVCFCLLSTKNIVELSTFLNSSTILCNGNPSNKMEQDEWLAVSDVCFYVKELALRRSCILSRRIASCTVESIKTFADECRTEVVSLNKFDIPNNKLKNVMKILKRILKNILESENLFIGEILKEIEETNKEILTRNNDVLFMKSINLHPKHIHFDSMIGPKQKEYLNSVFSDLLWKQVKSRLAKDYITSVFNDTVWSFRLTNKSLVAFEMEMLSQIQMKLQENGKCSCVKTFAFKINFPAGELLYLHSK